ncbi:MAG: hypothetical protein J0H55_03295 [Chitinophagaceae bacterium]|nr:hypothetical protein [Chitinophagaceae bacterium]
MRIIKLSLVLSSLIVLSSCLKSKNDFAGLRTNDNGGIVTSIAEDEYVDQDNHVIGFGYQPFANFDFSGPDEDVKFFTVHISQPRNMKVKGTLKLTVSMSNGSRDPLPAGAITIPATVDIPAFDSVARDVPVLFHVNKANLDPNADYSVVFTITGADQGAVSANASQIEVVLYNGKYFGRYMDETTVTDPNGVITITKNTRPVLLDNLALTYGRPSSIDDQSFLSFIDEYYVGLSGSSRGLSLIVNNLSSAGKVSTYSLIYPTYHLDASGKVDGVYDTRTGNNLNVTFTNDLSNKMVINNNGSRTFEVSYNVTVNAPDKNGTTTSRAFNVQEKYTYHPIQVRIFY